MAAWFPAVKAVLPYVTQIITLAIPAFTKKADKTGTGDISLNQISELQDAVTHNADSIKMLAIQVQQVINEIDTGSSRIERELKSLRRFAWLAVALSMFAVILSFLHWVR